VNGEAAAKTAEREAQRRYPADSLIIVTKSPVEAFIEGATWQREQSDFSESEREAELLPCPFCGSRAQVIECEEAANEGGLAVQCSTCLASSRVHFSCKEDARPFVISAWNARASWQREQPALSESERKEVLRVLEAAKRFAWHYRGGSEDSTRLWQDCCNLIRRLRSPRPQPALSESEREECAMVIECLIRCVEHKNVPTFDAIAALETGREFAARLRSPRPQRVETAPVGWRLVPEEMTKDMLIAGAAAVRDFFSEDGPYPRTKAMWRAILSALPHPAPDSVSVSRETLRRIRYYGAVLSRELSDEIDALLSPTEKE
jgi:Lar family restriction alleviation protein